MTITMEQNSGNGSDEQREEWYLRKTLIRLPVYRDTENLRRHATVSLEVTPGGERYYLRAQCDTDNPAKRTWEAAHEIGFTVTDPLTEEPALNLLTRVVAQVYRRTDSVTLESLTDPIGIALAEVDSFNNLGPFSVALGRQLAIVDGMDLQFAGNLAIGNTAEALSSGNYVTV